MFAVFRLLFATLVVLLFLSNTCHAQRSAPEYDPFYGSIAVGWSDVSDSYLAIDYEDTSWSLQAAAGYRYDWNWSVEVAWQTFDDVEADDVRGSGIDVLDFSTSVDTASLRARLWVPISNIYDQKRSTVAFVFAGLHASDISRSAIDVASGSMFEEAETDYGLTYGGGAIVGFGRFSLRGSIEWTDLDAPDSNIVSAMIGFEVYF